MANTRFQHKRSAVSGVSPTTSDIATAELAINIADRKLFTSNGTSVFELGSNLVNLSVTGNATINAIVANGSLGSAGQVLTSNGTTLYWSTVSGGPGGSPGGSNTQIQFNDSGSFAGDANLAFNKTTGTLSVGNTQISNAGITFSDSTSLNSVGQIVALVNNLAMP